MGVVGVNMKYTHIFLLLLLSNYLVLGQRVDIRDFIGAISDHQEIPVRTALTPSTKVETPIKRIIGGEIATPHDYPYQVALYIYIQITLYFCAGTLITPEWVLSAAHCINYATQILVVLGSHDLMAEEDSRVIYNTSTYVIHENWTSRTFQNDVALIRLPENVTLNNFINTIPFTHSNNSYDGETGRCLGWGRTTSEASRTVLRFVDLEVISNDKCISYEDYVPYIVDQHLCTSGIGIVGSCNEDSGGPLVVNGTQIAIVSFGVVNCSAGIPSVYVRLSYFSDWIEETMENFSRSDDYSSSYRSGGWSIYGLLAAVLSSRLTNNIVPFI